MYSPQLPRHQLNLYVMYVLRGFAGINDLQYLYGMIDTTVVYICIHCLVCHHPPIINAF